MKDEIVSICNQIESAVMHIYVQGCDDIAMNNITQLRGILMGIRKIKENIIKEGEDNA